MATSPPGANRPAGRRVGMQEVALRAGVAVSSVSRVLSGHPDVSDVMRNRVIDAVAALGYERDLLAQSLRRGATMTVGFVVGNISNPLIAEIALGAETTLREAGYAMLLANSMDDAELDRSHIRLFAQRRVDGLLLSLTDEDAPETIDLLDRVDLPCTMVDRRVAPGSPTSAVFTDHAAGIEDAVRLLASLGHTRIALVNGNPNVRPARERASALRRACRRHGNITAQIRSGPFTSDHGLASVTDLLAHDDPPSAIIAGSNQILVGVLQALRQTGTRVPDEISLVTCDEVRLADFLYPPLATITRDPHLLGSTAAELLLELLDGKTHRTVTLPTSFKTTESCAAPMHRLA